MSRFVSVAFSIGVLSACASSHSRLRAEYPSMYSDDGCPVTDALQAALTSRYQPGSPISLVRADFEARGGWCATTLAHDKTQCEVELGCSYSIHAEFQLSDGAIGSASFKTVQVLE
jgi:hypothetical protein